MTSLGAYHLLCPRCGTGFLEGATFTDCPKCGTRLEYTTDASAEVAATTTPRIEVSGVSMKSTPLGPASVELVAALASDKLPEHLDIDALFREALAGQVHGETIEAALKRVVGHKFPDAVEPLYKLLTQQLDLIQRLGGLDRQAAAEQLAKSHSELNTGAQGQHEIHTTRTHFSTSLGGLGLQRFSGTTILGKGLDELPAEQRKFVEEKLIDALRSGQNVSVLQAPFLESTLGLTAPSDFSWIALNELEAAGHSSATERIKLANKLWASSHVQKAYNRCTSRPLQIAAVLTVATILLGAGAGLSAGWVLGIAIAVALVSGALTRRYFQGRMRAAIREELEFPSAADERDS